MPFTFPVKTTILPTGAARVAPEHRAFSTGWASITPERRHERWRMAKPFWGYTDKEASAIHQALIDANLKHTNRWSKYSPGYH